MRSAEARAFLVLAREDLAVADELRSAHGRQAAFHLQQAAEKLTKAVLAVAGVEAPRSHQPGALAALLAPDHPWRADLAALDRLTGYATALRYPMPDGGVPAAPEGPDLDAALRKLSALLEAIEPWCTARLAV